MLTLLLTALFVLLGLQAIEIIIAIFSIGVGSTSQLLRLSSARGAAPSPFDTLQDELMETLDALSTAGVGTVVVLYLLA